ncbi:unnamed protein product [Closterium sp. NIES-53]
MAAHVSKFTFATGKRLKRVHISERYKYYAAALSAAHTVSNSCTTHRHHPCTHRHHPCTHRHHPSPTATTLHPPSPPLHPPVPPFNPHHHPSTPHHQPSPPFTSPHQPPRTFGLSRLYWYEILVVLPLLKPPSQIPAATLPTCPTLSTALNPVRYKVPVTAAGTTLFFACSIPSHCTAFRMKTQIPIAL